MEWSNGTAREWVVGTSSRVVDVYGLELHRARGTKEMIELLGSRSMHARGPDMLIIILFSLLLEISSVQVCLMK